MVGVAVMMNFRVERYVLTRPPIKVYEYLRVLYTAGTRIGFKSGSCSYKHDIEVHGHRTI